MGVIKNDNKIEGDDMGMWKAIGYILIVLGIIRVIYHVTTAQIILGKILIGLFVSILGILILYFGTEKRHYAFFITSVLFFAKLIADVLETYPRIMLYAWFDLTIGFALVIIGMILFYLRKGIEESLKTG